MELNPQVLDIVANDYADFAGGIYDRPEVDVHVGEARSFVKRTAERYDLIQIPLLYSFARGRGGTQGLHESYTYTIEALQDYMRALKPGGMLSITLWLKLPPRDTPKLFATAVEALDRLGVDAPGTSARADPQLEDDDPPRQERRLSCSEEIEALVAFAAERSFDVDYYPGISPDGAEPLQHPRAALLLRGGDRPDRA